MWRPIKQRLFQLKIALSSRTWSNCEGCLVKERNETKEFPHLPKTLGSPALKAFSRRDLGGPPNTYSREVFGRPGDWDFKQNELKLNSDFMAIPCDPLKGMGENVILPMATK